MVSATFHVHHSFSAGRPLAAIEKTILEIQKATTSREGNVMSRRISELLQCIQNLRGATENPKLLDKRFTEQVNSLAENKNSGAKLILCFAFMDQMMLAYLFGDNALAASSGQVARTVFELPAPGIDRYRVALFDGLTSLECYRRGDRKRHHLSNARKHLKRLKKIAYLAPQNMLGQYHLLQAQLLATTASSTSNQRKAVVKFMESIALFDKCGRSMERGLSNWLFGSFLEKVTGQKQVAQVHFQRAASIWEDWGALALVSHLVETHPNYFPQATGGSSYALSSEMAPSGVRAC